MYTRDIPKSRGKSAEREAFSLKFLGTSGNAGNQYLELGRWAIIGWFSTRG